MSEQCDVFVPFDQNLSSFHIAVIVLCAPSNHLAGLFSFSSYFLALPIPLVGCNTLLNRKTMQHQKEGVEGYEHVNTLSGIAAVVSGDPGVYLLSNEANVRSSELWIPAFRMV